MFLGDSLAKQPSVSRESAADHISAKFANLETTHPASMHALVSAGPRKVGSSSLFAAERPKRAGDDANPDRALPQNVGGKSKKAASEPRGRGEPAALA